MTPLVWKILLTEKVRKPWSLKCWGKVLKKKKKKKCLLKQFFMRYLMFGIFFFGLPDSCQKSCGVPQVVRPRRLGTPLEGPIFSNLFLLFPKLCRIPYLLVSVAVLLVPHRAALVKAPSRRKLSQARET